MYKDLLKHTIFYGLGIGLLRFLNFVLLPLYTRYFTPDDVGVLELLFILFTFLTTFLGFGMGSGIFKYLTSKGRNSNDQVTIISSTFWILTVVASIVLLILNGCFNSINKIFFNSLLPRNIYRLLLIASFLQILSIIPTALIRLEKKSVLFGGIQIFRFLIEFTIIISLVLIFSKNYGSVFVSKIIGGSFTLIILLLVTKGWIKFNFSIKKIRPLMFYSVFLMPAILSNNLINLSNRFFVKSYLSVKDVALFSVGSRIPMILSIIIMAFQYIWPVYLFKIQKRSDAPIIYGEVFTYYTSIISFIALIIIFFSSDILTIMATEKYLSAINVVKIISISFIFWGMFYSGTAGIHITGKTYFITIIMISSAILNIILNQIFIPKFGINGAALSTLASYILMGCGSVLISYCLYKIKFQWKKLIVICITFVLVFTGSKIDVITVSLIVKIIAIIGIFLLWTLLKLFPFRWNHIKRVFV